MNKKDYAEVFGPTKYLTLLKRAIYVLLRPFWNRKFKKNLSFLKGDYAYENTDVFVKKDGGLFKSYALKVCDSLHLIKGSSILVVGCGMGGAILQIIARKPDYILAFDPQEFIKEWDELKEFAEKKGVKLDFIKGDFKSIPKLEFDIVISDAVLQYISDVDEFFNNIQTRLKKGGVFYASWGPTYFMDLNDDFSHLGKDVWEDYSQAYMGKFSTENVLKSLERNNLQKRRIIAQVLSVDTSSIDARLDSLQVPKLDRHCKGFYLWAVKN